MVKISRMTEKQVTKAYFVDKKITLTQYQHRLKQIAESRYKSMISKAKNKSSMSSSKWK